MNFGEHFRSLARNKRSRFAHCAFCPMPVEKICDGVRNSQPCLTAVCKKKHLHRIGDKDFCPDCAPQGAEKSKGD